MNNIIITYFKFFDLDEIGGSQLSHYTNNIVKTYLCR